IPLLGCLSPSRSSRCLKRSRSSARSIMSGEVPRIGTLARSSASASLSGVWPPNWTMTPCSVPFARSVSTDYDTSDRLYFEPLTAEDVLEIIDTERANGTLHGELDALADA